MDDDEIESLFKQCLKALCHEESTEATTEANTETEE